MEVYMDCLFCKIIEGEIPSYKIFEDEVCYAFLDIHPQKMGHTLIIPKEHIQDMYVLKDEVYLHMVSVAKTLAKKYEEKLHCTGFSLCQNVGSAQEVKQYCRAQDKENEKVINAVEAHHGDVEPTTLEAVLLQCLLDTFFLSLK